jgi:hypothetical protein
MEKSRKPILWWARGFGKFGGHRFTECICVRWFSPAMPGGGWVQPQRSQVLANGWRLGALPFAAPQQAPWCLALAFRLVCLLVVFKLLVLESACTFAALWCSLQNEMCDTYSKSFTNLRFRQMCSRVEMKFSNLNTSTHFVLSWNRYRSPVALAVEYWH